MNSTIGSGDSIEYPIQRVEVPFIPKPETIKVFEYELDDPVTRAEMRAYEEGP